MISYSVFVESSVTDTLMGLKPKSRDQVLRFLKKLRSNPFFEDDYFEVDEIGRPMQVMVVGKLAVVFWADHAVKEVKIIDLRSADR